MKFDEYQEFVEGSSRIRDKYWYSCLGLAGETGEVIEIIKKVVRDHGGDVNPELKRKLALELGDVLWYLTRLASELEIDLEAVVEMNVEKINHRKVHGKE